MEFLPRSPTGLVASIAGFWLGKNEGGSPGQLQPAPNEEETPGECLLFPAQPSSAWALGHPGRDQPPSLWEIARRVHPESGLMGAGRRVLFALRSLRHRDAALSWYRWLDGSFMASATAVSPGLYKKIVRPYVTPKWSAAEKFCALRDHYHFVATRLGDDAFYRLLVYPGLPVLEFGARGERYRIFLGYDARCNKEGELSFLMFSEKHNLRVSSLTGVIVRDPTGAAQFLIGCVQGLSAGADKNIIKEIARSLHGLRPKALLLFLVQELAGQWGVDSVRGVGNRTHISRHAAYVFNASRRPKLTYDEFWTESGGNPTADGFFDLPRAHVSRQFSEIKSGRRSLYLQRYRLMDEVGGKFRRSLARQAREQA